MLITHRRSVRDVLFPKLFKGVCSAALAMVLLSCNTGLPVQRDSERMREAASVPAYSIVFVIHGDNDYMVHDSAGNEHEADDDALAGATTIAQKNPSAEVFIFHQQPGRSFLFFFPLRDGEFYYYRNGQLVAKERYWRDQEDPHFEPEAELYHRFGAGNRSGMVNLFLYYGHEIPEFGGTGYDASYPDRPFTIQNFAEGLQDFTRDSVKFDLMILSTCYGGTPYTIGALGAFARFIIASPDNLHLSYFDLHALERLDLSLKNGDVPALATTFARRAFERLSRDLQTAVSVGLYDVARVQDYIRSVRSEYETALAGLQRATPASRALMEHCDCADVSAYAAPAMHQGIEILYRPPHFGRSKNKQHHSGWECWRLKKPQDEVSKVAYPYGVP
jgi:hypothetical protein